MIKRVKNVILKYFNKENIAIILLISCLIIISVFNISLIFYSPPKITETKQDLLNPKEAFWKNFLALHPTYFEGWIELGTLQIRSGDFESAKNSYQKAFAINPNSEKLLSLKQKLGV